MIWLDVDTDIELFVNSDPMLAAADGTTVDEGVTYDEAGMDLIWHFITTAGVVSSTAVTPTTGDDYDWAHTDGGMYKIEMTASGGASANNDTEGFGWFTGNTTANLTWRSPTYGFRAAALNNALIDGGDTLDVNVTAMANDVITPAAVDEDANFVIQALSITNALDAGSVLVDGTTTLTGNVSCGAGFDVVGALSANSLLIDTTTTLTGNVSMGGTFDVVGALTAGSVSIDAGFDVVGAFSANSLLIDTTTTLTGAVATGGVTLASLSITGQLDLGNLLVDGTTALTGAVTAPAGITANITGNLSGTVAGVTPATAADVNAQVLDVMTVDTFTLPGQEALPLTPTFEEAVMFLYKFLRNRKKTDATSIKVYADNETTVDQKTTISDDGTDFIEQEWVSGP